MLLDVFDEGYTAGGIGAQPGYFAGVEAWEHILSDNRVTHTYSTVKLSESEVEDWASRKGSAQAPPSGAKLRAGIRILFAQSVSTRGRSIPSILRKEKVIQGLSLPACTFASFNQPSGAYSSHTIPQHSSDGEFTRLDLVHRTPQKWECSLGGFAISHDFETHMTTALSLSNAFALDEYQSTPPKALASFIARLENCKDSWKDPLLLPCLFLATHVLKVREYVLGTVSQRVALLEHRIGVTKAGRTQKKELDRSDGEQDERLFVGEKLQRHQAKKLIASINDLSTWIIFAQRSPQWDIECIDFLLRLQERETKLYTRDRTLRETLLYLRNMSEGNLEVTQTSQERMKLQLNILYTSIAQDDGQTSARIAASSGKDSTSMKIIALITAAYLPGTFVATLFSMGMFDWQSSTSSAGNSSVSPDFWIYWAIAVPLTIVTIAGWATWWKFEKYRFERDVQQAIQDKSSHSLMRDMKLPWTSQEKA